MNSPDKTNKKDFHNLCKLALDHGGDISKLLLPSSETIGDGITNGSILYHKGKWLLNLRRVGYLFYHSENEQKFPSPWGPLVYLNPEDDVVLRTKNYICELDDNFEVSDWKKTNTDGLDKKPRWSFIGLEDARLQFWNNELYQTGVRRDTTTNGEGRMELSTIKNLYKEYLETDRVRISPPDPRTHANGGSYCEKNWMPINDMPNHYIKWTLPTEVVKVNPKKGTSEVVHLVDQPHLKNIVRDPRGSSNIIKYKDYWVGIIHEVDLWFNVENEKDSIYYHRFIVWDKNWNIKYTSDTFDFMTARVEFTCGLGFDGKDFLIPFGFQDSTSYLLKLPTAVFENITGMSNKKLKPKKVYDESNKKNKNLYNFINDPYNSINAFNLADEYFKDGHWASALSFYLRSVEFTDDPILEYDSHFMVCRSMANRQSRPVCELKMWYQLIEHSPNRPEGYQAISNYHSWRGNFQEAYLWSDIGLRNSTVEPKQISINQGPIGYKKHFEIQKNLFGGNAYTKTEDKLNQLKHYLSIDDKSSYPPDLHNWIKGEVEKYKASGLIPI